MRCLESKRTCQKARNNKANLKFKLTQIFKAEIAAHVTVQANVGLQETVVFGVPRGNKCVCSSAIKCDSGPENKK